MKKKNLLKVRAGLFVIALVAVTVFAAQTKLPKDILLMQNIEALTSVENPGSHNHGPTKNPLFGSKYCANTNQVDCAY